MNPASVIHLDMVVILGADFATHITNSFITNPGTYAQRLEATFKYGTQTFPHMLIIAIVADIIFMVPTQTYIF